MNIKNKYIVVTPCRNEEKNLPNLVQSLVAQTITPVLWIIVDDGSTDKTGEIIVQAGEKYEWIKGIHLEKHKEYMGTHLAYVCNVGFGFAENYCNKNNKYYAHIALVDADNILEENYFEKLIKEFEKDEKLGIASGNNAFADIETVLSDLKAKNPNMTVMSHEFWEMWDSPLVQLQNNRDDLPMGSARMWRKECFEDTGGYLSVPAPDSVSNAKAKLKGWKTRRFRDIRIIERRGLTKQGLWSGYKEIGEYYSFLGYPLLLIVLKALKYSFKKPYYSGAAFIYGYAKFFISGKKRVEDDEIRYYYKHVRIKELRAFYKEKLKKLLRLGKRSI